MQPHPAVGFPFFRKEIIVVSSVPWRIRSRTCSMVIPPFSQISEAV